MGPADTIITQDKEPFLSHALEVQGGLIVANQLLKVIKTSIFS